MRLNVTCVALAQWSILLAIGPVHLHAAISRSFDVDRCTWDATHIVLVQTTAYDGVISIVESWKGDLKPGDSIEIPELKPDVGAVPISTYTKLSESAREELGTIHQIPRQAIGGRMILFLKKQEGDGARSLVKWRPASESGMEYSVIWIDGGRAFCIRDVMMLGRSTLSPCFRWPVRSTEVAVFTARVQEVLQAKWDLADTLSVENVNVRSERLGRIALSDVIEAQKEAVDALGKTGTVALPEILQVMDKPPVCYDGAALIRVFVEAAGKDSGKQLNARLQQDVIYWKTVGPTLTQSWLDQLITVGSPLQVKFQETILLIQELDREHYAPAVQTVAELRSFWVSQPQLYDPEWGGKQGEVRTFVTGLDAAHSDAYWLAEQCDAFLKRAGKRD